MEIFKSRFADNNNNNSSRAGFAGGTKRSMSGSLLPNPLRANSVSHSFPWGARLRVHVGRNATDFEKDFKPQIIPPLSATR